MRVEYPGTFYGECNQICGINHAFMPIKVVAVSKPEFETVARRGEAEIRLQDARGGRRGSGASRPRSPPPIRPRTDSQRQPEAHDELSRYSRRRPRRARRPSAGLCRALAVLDQPQGHRHAVPDLRDHRRADRRPDVGRHARPADASGQRAHHRPSVLQRADHGARPDHGVLRRHAGDVRRVRQLVRAADDRRAGHGLPAHEQCQLLAAGPVVSAAVRLAVRRLRRGRQRRRRRGRLDDLPAAVRRQPGRASRPVDRHGDPVAASRRAPRRS